MYIIVLVILYNLYDGDSGMVTKIIILVAFSSIILLSIFSIIWQIYGKEILHINEDNIIIQKKLFNYTREKKFIVEDILNIWKQKTKKSMIELQYIYFTYNIFSNFGNIHFEFKESKKHYLEFGGFLPKGDIDIIAREITQSLAKYRKFEIPDY